ncbi:MAG TPA: MFS transporter [Gammaproteobacteria bacterium]|nr:MFS transporter [Gammaproteobacteria bacterium]
MRQHRLREGPALRPARGLAFEWIRWRLYAVLSFSFLLGFFYRMAPGVVAGTLMKAFDASGVALGVLVATYFYVYTAMQMPAGILADTVGPRLSAGVGALLAGAGSIVFGLAQTFAAAATGRFLMGLGASTIFIGLLKINTTWFRPERHGAANGLSMFVGNLGSVLAAGPFAVVLLWLSWRTVFAGAGVLSLVLGLFTLAYVRDRPEHAGFDPAAGESHAYAMPVAHWGRDLLAVLRNRQVWAGLCAQFGLGGSFFGFVGLWGVPLMHQGFGLSRTRASLYPTAAMAGLAVGALLAGWLSDRVGRRKPFMIGGPLITGFLWLVFLLAPWSPGWQGLSLCGLIGLIGSGTSVAYAAASETVPPRQAGMAMAAVNTGLFLGVAVAQPVLGWLLDLGWTGRMAEGARFYSLADYRHALWFSFALVMLSLIASAFIRETYCRNLVGRAPPDSRHRDEACTLVSDR